MPQHPELLVQRDNTAGGRRLQLPEGRRCEQYEGEKERGTGGEHSVRHRPGRYKVRLEAKMEGGKEGRREGGKERKRERGKEGKRERWKEGG
jgi:hypothetical protein